MNSGNDVLNAKSIHLFAWPFKFDGNKTFSLHKISAELLHKGWRRKFLNVSGQQDSAQAATNFMLQQYLSTDARNIFAPENASKNNENCCVYTYPHDLEQYEYLIAPNGVDAFRLEIACIELHVYHHGVGILWVQLANHQYTNIADIKLINDLGRRITLPFIPGAPYEVDGELHNGFMLCAEQLGIAAKDDTQPSFITDYRALCNAWPQHPENIQTLQRPAQFLLDLLHCRIGATAPNTKQGLFAKRGAADFTVRSFADDRMFTLCIIRDDDLSAELETMQLEPDPIPAPDATPNPETTPDSDSVAVLVDTLYQIAYVDPNRNSCPNAAMQKELLERALYPRWSAAGTVHLVTNYSMICITSRYEGINNSVVKPFLVEYAYCISLVLAQRIGISEFSVKAGAIVKGVEKKGLISSKKTKDLINLQEQYITFKNELLVSNFTRQEQGVELYDLLQKQLLIHKEQAVLDGQLEALYEVTNVSNSNKLTNLALFFAIVAILLDVLFSVSSIWGQEILAFFAAM